MTSERHAWLRTVHLLTRDPVPAQRLLARAPEDDPAAAVRRWVRARPRRAAGPLVVRLDDGPGLGHDDLWDRLGALPRAQQAVLVLHHHDGAGPAEVAALLRRDEAGVAEALAAGSAALGRPAPGVLTALLAARAADAPTTLGPPPAPRRRQLGVAAAAVALVAVLGGVALVASNPTVAGTAGAAPLPDPARYLGGSHLLGSARVDPATGRASVSFTPTGAGVILATSCDDSTATTSTTVDGAALFSGRCGGTATFAAAEQDAVFPGGKPVTVALAVEQGTGAAQLAVYEATTLDDYVFPPPPDDPSAPPSYGTALASAATLGRNADTTVVLAVGGTSRLFVSTAAPGRVTVSVDGTTVSSVTATGSAATTTAVDLSPAALAALGIVVRSGDRIQVAVVASGFGSPGWVVSATQ